MLPTQVKIPVFLEQLPHILNSKVTRLPTKFLKFSCNELVVILSFELLQLEELLELFEPQELFEPLQLHALALLPEQEQLQLLPLFELHTEQELLYLMLSE